MTGHSRGGALANLVGAKLIDEGKRVFAYTFAAPATTTADTVHDTKYKSIFNIVNTDDFIPYFPIKKWRFKRYGRTTAFVSVSRMCEDEWNSRVAGKKYNWDEYGLTDAYDIMYSSVKNRNECYVYNDLDNAMLSSMEVYETFPQVLRKYIRLDGLIMYQQPLLLMKMLALYLGKDETGNSVLNVVEFIALPLTPLLTNVRK